MGLFKNWVACLISANKEIPSLSTNSSSSEYKELSSNFLSAKEDAHFDSKLIAAVTVIDISN